MKYLIDSDWLAEYLRGRAAAKELLEYLFPSGLAISIITYAEIYEGVLYGPDRHRHEEGFHAFVASVRLLGITRSIARRYGALHGMLRQRGHVIDQPDLFIAATALEHDLTLVTRNLKDFDRVPGLQLHK